jgi:laccase
MLIIGMDLNNIATVGQMDQLISQCPIQTGNSYTYEFNITGQRGTLWWHAHVLWLRATVYGAIVIMPKLGTPFPFPQPAREFEILLGKYYKDHMIR